MLEPAGTTAAGRPHTEHAAAAADIPARRCGAPVARLVTS